MRFSRFMTLMIAISVSGERGCFSEPVEAGSFSGDSRATAAKENAPASRQVIIVSF
jgi:hypothetical protein